MATWHRSCLNGSFSVLVAIRIVILQPLELIVANPL